MAKVYTQFRKNRVFHAVAVEGDEMVEYYVSRGTARRADAYDKAQRTRGEQQEEAFTILPRGFCIGDAEAQYENDDIPF